MLRKNLISLCAAILILLCATASFAQLDVNADQYLDNNAGSGLASEKISDLNFNAGDDYRDLVVTNTWTNYGGHVYVNRHTATPPYFTLHPSITLPQGFSARFGKLRPGPPFFQDLVVARNTITTYFNYNDGTLHDPHTYANGYNDYVAIGRINWQDSWNDLAGSDHYGSHIVNFFWNDGDGTFTPHYPSLNPNPYKADQVELVDLDNHWQNTLPELIVACEHELKIFNSNGDGTFALRQTLQVSPYYNDPIMDVAIGDINGDDLPDIIATILEWVKVFVNTEDGYFYENQTLTNQSYFDQVTLTHYDQDRFPDLVCSHGAYLKIYLNIPWYPPYSVEFQTTPSWTGTMASPPEYVNAEEVIPVDITGTGALSLVCTGKKTNGSYTLPGIWVFKDHSDPRAHHPVNVQVTDCGVERHPLIQWKPNEEDDLLRYRIYRALMEDETPPTENDFTLIDSVGNDVSQYIDNDVYMTQQYANFKIWYYVTAVDQAYQESLASNFVRFWGLYRPESEGPGAFVSGVTVPLEFGCIASPNPFNPTTTISYTLPKATIAKVTVCDMNGRLVSTLINDWQNSGTHQVTFDGSNLSSGLYLYKVDANGQTLTGKMVLMK